MDMQLRRIMVHVNHKHGVQRFKQGAKVGSGKHPLRPRLLWPSSKGGRGEPESKLSLNPKQISIH